MKMTKAKQHILMSWTMEDAIQYLQKHFLPEDVFQEKALIKWAKANGWTKAK